MQAKERYTSKRVKLSNSKSIVIQKPIGKDWKTTVGNRYHFPVKCAREIPLNWNISNYQCGYIFCLCI